MNAPPGPLTTKDVNKTQDEIRGSEIGPAPRREALLRRVRAARKRLSPMPGATARLH